MKSLSCSNKHCPPARKGDAGAIIRHGFYMTRWGKRRRYQCQMCGKTFCSTTGTPYHRLQHRRTTFDEVAALSVEGLNKSAIARVQRLAWNTVDRWLERAAGSCRRFNDRRTTGLAVVELQADEIRTIVGSKQDPIWVFIFDRGLVSALDLHGGRQTELPQHAGAVSRCFQPNAAGSYSPDHHGRIRVLRKSDPARLWTRLSLWPGDQDTPQRSRGEGGAQNQARKYLAMGTGVTGLRGLLAPEHLGCRTPQSHDPTRLGVSV